MTTTSKFKKKYLALSVAAIVAISLGSLATTYTISNSIDTRLTKYVENFNQYMQDEELMVLKPKLVLKEVNKGFFHTDFTVAVEIENGLKMLEIQKLAKMKANKEGFIVYTIEQIKTKEDYVNSLSDSIHLFDIKNSAKHGPFPQISQFNFKPAVMSIDSLTSFNELGDSIKAYLQNEKIFDKTTIDGIATHNFIMGETLVNFDKTIDSKFQSLPFDWNMSEFAVKHEGMAIHFSGAEDFELKVDSAPLHLTQIPNFNLFDDAKEYNKILTLSKQKQPNLSMTGFNFAQTYKKGDIPAGSINFSLLPIKYTKLPETTADVKNEGVSDSVNFEGFNYEFERTVMNDQKYTEVFNLGVKPVQANIVDYNPYTELSSLYNINSTLIELNSNTTFLNTDFLLKAKELRSQDLKKIREMIIGNISQEDLEQTQHLSEFITRLLDIYRLLSVEGTVTLKPFDIKIANQFEDINSNIDMKVGTYTSSLTRESSDLSIPLKIKSHLDSFEFQESKDNISISLKDYSANISIPLKNFYPFNLEYTLGEFAAKNNTINIASAQDFKIGLSLIENEKTIDFAQGFSAKNIFLNNMELGNFELKDAIGNLNKEAFTQLQDVFLESLILALDNDDFFTPPEDVFAQNFMAKAPLHFASLASNGINYAMGPYSFSSNQGKADASLKLNFKPLTEASLLQSAGSFESSISLLDNLSFSLDADVNYLADTAARFTTLNTMDLGDAVDESKLKEIRQQFTIMIPSMIQTPPADQLINVSDTKLTSQIEFKDGQFTVNGSPKTIEEISALLGL